MRKTIAQLGTELAACREHVEVWRSNAEKALSDLKAAEARNADALIKVSRNLADKDKAVAALKAELFRALQTISSQQGYLARVLEDDNMRELGPVQPEPPTNQIQPAPQSRRMGVPMFNSFDNTYGDTYSRRESSTPWHDR